MSSFTLPVDGSNFISNLNKAINDIGVIQAQIATTRSRLTEVEASNASTVSVSNTANTAVNALVASRGIANGLAELDPVGYVTNAQIPPIYRIGNEYITQTNLNALVPLSDLLAHLGLRVQVFEGEGWITNAKLSSDFMVSSSSLPPSGVLTLHLADASVVEYIIADRAVTGVKIALKSINASHVQNGSLTGSVFASNLTLPGTLTLSGTLTGAAGAFTTLSASGTSTLAAVNAAALTCTTLAPSGTSTLQALTATTGSFSSTLSVSSTSTLRSIAAAADATYDIGASGTRFSTSYVHVSNMKQIDMAADSTRTATAISADTTKCQILIHGNGSAYHDFGISVRYGTAGFLIMPLSDYTKRVGLFLDSTYSVSSWGPGNHEASNLGTTGSRWLYGFINNLVGQTGYLSSTLTVVGTSTMGAVNTGALTATTFAPSGTSTLQALTATTGSFSSTLVVSGTTTLAALSATTGSLSSTLGVTGAATLSSTLGVTGATTLSSTLAVTGATTLSSTLGVTGTSTLGYVNAGTVACSDLLTTTYFTATNTMTIRNVNPYSDNNYKLGDSGLAFSAVYATTANVTTVNASGAITGDDLVAQASSDRTLSAIAANTNLCQLRLLGNGAAGDDFGITTRYSSGGLSITPLSDWTKRLTITTTSVGPGVSAALDLGTSSAKWNAGYMTNHHTQGLILDADSNRTSTNIQADNTLSQIYITGNGSSYHNWCITNRYGSGGLVFFPDGNYEDRMGIFASGSRAEWGPGSNEGTDLGTSSSRWNEIFVKTVSCDVATITGTSSIRDCNPQTNNTYSLGTTSLRWKKGWFVDIDSTNAVNVSSDARLKKEITDLEKEKTIRFVNSLRPVTYKLDPERVIGADSDTHIGLIAQEVKASLECVFGSSMNQSLLSTSSDGVMGLRYTELIGSLITCIQDLTQRVDFLEKYRASTIRYDGNIEPMTRDIVTPTPVSQLPAAKKYKFS